MIERVLGTQSKNVFAGDLSIPPLKVGRHEDVSLFYQWDTRYTKVTKVIMSWAAETSGWLAGTGQVVADIMLNSVIMDRHEFTTPGYYANTLDITSAFFNGPNVFTPWFFWQYLPNVTWITCKMRVDITITYEGEPPPPPTTGEEWKKYLPYIGLGIGSGILIYMVTR